MDDMDPATILEDAADLLLIHGRCTGEGIDGEGRMCVRGAIAKAQGRDPHEAMNIMGVGGQPAVRALERYLVTDTDVTDRYEDKYGRTELIELARLDGRLSAWIWNDYLATDDEVRDTLLLVAKDLRNEATHD